eukprot:s1566_g16.t1
MTSPDCQATNSAYETLNRLRSATGRPWAKTQARQAQQVYSRRKPNLEQPGTRQRPFGRALPCRWPRPMLKNHIRTYNSMPGFPGCWLR